jgi:periplasmic protein TonB
MIAQIANLFTDFSRREHFACARGLNCHGRIPLAGAPPKQKKDSEVSMFERSLVVSGLQTVSATKRWTMVGSTALQVAIAATLIVIPLFHPERMAAHIEAPIVFTPPPPKPPLPVERVVVSNVQASTVPSLPVTVRRLTPVFEHSAATADQEAQPAIAKIGDGMMTGTVGDALGEVSRSGPAVSMAPTKPPQKIHVSAGVTAGMLLAPIRPVYPAIARASHVSGAVVVEAVISKTGTIESLHVTSGPEMLRSAALDAIRAARYRPYLLNGEPTEVQTTITVNFTFES